MKCDLQKNWCRCSRRRLRIPYGGLVERWESAETVIAALKLCMKIVREQDPLTMQNLSRQLRHWRRVQGHENVGWLEVREVNGRGPYVYYRCFVE
mgnify:CR=1 FL=1